MLLCTVDEDARDRFQEELLDLSLSLQILLDQAAQMRTETARQDAYGQIAVVLETARRLVRERRQMPEG